MTTFENAQIETALLPARDAVSQETTAPSQAAVNAATLAHIQAYDDLAAARRALVRSVDPSSLRH